MFRSQQLLIKYTMSLTEGAAWLASHASKRLLKLSLPALACFLGWDTQKGGGSHDEKMKDAPDTQRSHQISARCLAALAAAGHAHPGDARALLRGPTDRGLPGHGLPRLAPSPDPAANVRAKPLPQGESTCTQLTGLKDSPRRVLVAGGLLVGLWREAPGADASASADSASDSWCWVSCMASSTDLHVYADRNSLYSLTQQVERTG